MPKPIGDSSRYNPALDGIRTLAVVGVVLYHMKLNFIPGGLLGVGVFFTISGFLITGNLMRSWDRKGSLRLGNFWLRRIRRLMPAVIVTVLTVWMLTAFFKPEDFKLNLFAGLAAIFYINNWTTILSGNSYFDQFQTGPLEHVWSLSIEEQFYVFWPLILLLLLVLFRKKRFLVTVFTLLLAAASFAWMWFLFTPGADPTRVYEGTDTRAGGLLVGAALAIYYSNRKKTGSPRLWAEIAGVIGAVGIIASFILIPDNSPLLYQGGLIALTVFSTLLLMGVSNKQTLVYKIFGLRPFAWVGERSYALYLWHIPMIAFLSRPLQQMPIWLATLIVMVGSTVLASLSWSLIEDPIRRKGLFKPAWEYMTSRRQRLPRPLWSLPVALACAIALLGVPAYAADDYYQKQDLAKQKLAAQKLKAAREKEAAEQGISGGEKYTQTRCREVVHIGDSTSLAMFKADSVNSPDQTGDAAYRAVGAQTVVNSSLGARATNMALGDDPSGNDSIKKILNEGVDPQTCWVIALGVNNAANMAVAGRDNAAEEIKTTMEILEPNYPVMWVAPVTSSTMTPRWYDEPRMQHWNESLFAAMSTYPNLWVYRWDQEVDQSWFLEGDGVHYNQEGNTQRSLHFSQALVKAFPKTNKPLKTKGDSVLAKKTVPVDKRMIYVDR